MSHRIEKCVHGVVTAQCRCRGPHNVYITPCPERCRAEVVEITGVELRKTHAHLGGKLEVRVRLTDGSYRVAITEVADDGPIGYFADAAGADTWRVESGLIR